jgi:hypothetical protein
MSAAAKTALCAAIAQAPPSCWRPLALMVRLFWPGFRGA